MKNRSIFSLFGGMVFLLILVGCAASLPPLPPPEARMKIAVVGMREGKIDQKVADMLTTALSKSGYFTLIEREKVKQVIEEQGFRLSGIVAPETIVRLGNLLDAQAIVKAEVVNTKVTPVNWGIMRTLHYSATVTANIMDAKTGKTIAAISESGTSTAGGVPAEIEYGGQKKQDILGTKRSEEDMFNSAVRSAVENSADAIIKAAYEKDKKIEVMDADARPNVAIESLTKNVSDTDYFAARAKIYYAPFDIVWIAVNRYLKTQGNIITSDMANGVVIVQKSTYDFKLHDFATVEKVSEDSTKVTVKGFCYKYTMYHPPHQHLTGWNKLGTDFCSGISLKGIKKNINRAMEEAKK